MKEPRRAEADNLADIATKARNEPISAFLGTKLADVKPGYSCVTIKLKAEHRTFNGFIFGGIIMSVADQAFSFAVNSFGRPSVATQFNIHFVAAAKPGDELTAECRVVRTGRRVDIAEITVVDQDGKLIARATGTAIPLA